MHHKMTNKRRGNLSLQDAREKRISKELPKKNCPHDELGNDRKGTVKQQNHSLMHQKFI